MTHHTDHPHPAASRSAVKDPVCGMDGEAAEWTCPMHPEIRRPGPGSCPICGMALEPVLATADAGPSRELVEMTRRFWVGLALTVPVVLLEMGRDLVPAVREVISPSVAT